MDKKSENNIPLHNLAIKNLQDLLAARTVPPETPHELMHLDGYPQLYEMLLEIRTAIMALASGNLSFRLTTKGYLPGAIKTLQASLLHLTWQTKMIASGDFSQQVDFMGELSEGFNSMAKQLEESTRKLEFMAHVDLLTGINNRRYFMELLTTEVDRCKRYNRGLSLLMFDIDHFKSVNDTRGHAAGDEALRSIKLIFQKSGLRDCDFYGRMGGEEFALSLPETNIQGATKVAERIRQEVENTEILYDNNPFFITASIGISEYQSGDTLETLIKRSDDAMYRAKTSGRNKVCDS